MKKYGVEISHALQKCKVHGFGSECISFVEYLVDQTVETHNKDKSA